MVGATAGRTDARSNFQACIDARIALLEKHLVGTDHRAIKHAADALNRATGDFAARRMDAGIKRALAGRKIGSF